MRGLVHIYCGDGKGKTTSAVGLCVRAVGAGKCVCFAQFLKSGSSSELEPLRRLGVKIVETEGVEKFLFAMSEAEKEKCRQESERLLREAFAVAEAENGDLLVLDELCAALQTGMVSQDLVLHLATTRPEKLELVITGRSPAPELTELADYITEMRKVRHPYDLGIEARPGIEY